MKSRITVRAIGEVYQIVVNDRADDVSAVIMKSLADDCECLLLHNETRYIILPRNIMVDAIIEVEKLAEAQP